MKLWWTKSAIKSLVRKVKEGTKLFTGHGKGTNDHTGRRPVGEVVSTFIRDVGDKVQAVALTILDPGEESNDVCSIEADVLTEEQDGTELVSDVDDVTAIAIGSSKVDSPAFVGAQKLASLQCFGSEYDGEGADDKGKEIPMKYSEVRDGARELNMKPSDIFNFDDLVSDPRYGKRIAKASEEVEAATKERDEFKAKFQEVTEKLEESGKEIQKAKAGETLKGLIPEGTPGKVRTYIETRFNPEHMGDFSEDSLKKYVEDSKKKYADDVKFFGVSDDTAGGGASEGGPSGEADAPDDDAVDIALKEAMGE